MHISRECTTFDKMLAALWMAVVTYQYSNKFGLIYCSCTELRGQTFDVVSTKKEMEYF